MLRIFKNVILGKEKNSPLRVFFVVLVFAALFGAPVLASAHEINVGIPYWGPILSCNTEPDFDSPFGGFKGDVCDSFCDILHTTQHAIYLGLTLIIFVFVPIGIAAGGMTILVSAGNSDLHSTGKKIITGSVIVAVFTGGAFLVIATFLWTLGNPEEGTVDPETGLPAARVSWPNISCTGAPDGGAGSFCAGDTFGVCPEGERCVQGSDGTFSCQPRGPL